MKFLRSEVTIPPDLMRGLVQGSALKPLGFAGRQSKQLTFSILTHRLGPAASTPANRNRTASLVGGSRDRTLADAPDLDYSTAAEILFLLDKLEKAGR